MPRLSKRIEWWVCRRYSKAHGPPSVRTIPWDYWGPACKTSRAAHAAIDSMSDEAGADVRREDGFVVVRVEYHEEAPPKARKARRI